MTNVATWTKQQIEQWYEQEKAKQAARNAYNQQQVLGQNIQSAQNIWPNATAGGYGGTTGATTTLYPQIPSYAPNVITPPPPRDERIDYLEQLVGELSRAAAIELAASNRAKNELRELEPKVIQLYAIIEWLKNNAPEVWEQWEMVQKTKERLTR